VFKRWFGRSEKEPSLSTEGRVIYAVGDVHGRLDLLEALAEQIVVDARETAPADPPVLVFLGDYVDRGPQSPGVVEFVRALSLARDFEVRTLMGNHEQVMLSFLDDPKVGPSWVEFGGGATLAAYGVAPPTPRSDDEAWIEASATLGHLLPQDQLSFLRALETFAIYGDYMFVHAGVRPSVALDRQDAADMLWIRQEFLENDRRLDKIIVHGHTPEMEPHLGRARIGIDTGAYATGVLTAVRLSGSDQSILQARAGRK
jgi:serine/threonine protein phosphatase 1